MNYKKAYHNLISKRKNSSVPSDVYGEWHHIVPKSLGGSDDSSNLVRLTAREHFICHALLAEMYEKGSNEWHKMNHAFMMMRCEGQKQQRYINSRYYELKKQDFSKVMSVQQTGNNNSQYGTCWICRLDPPQNKRIPEHEVDTYLGKGWSLGRVLNFDKFISKKKRKKEINRVYSYNGVPFSYRKLISIREIFNLELRFNFKKGIQKLKELLAELYVEEKLSTVEIASMYGTSDPTIRTYLLDLKIGTRNRSGKW